MRLYSCARAHKYRLGMVCDVGGFTRGYMFNIPFVVALLLLMNMGVMVGHR